MSDKMYNKKGKKRSLMKDDNLADSSSGDRTSSFSSQLLTDFEITPKRNFSQKSNINYDEMELNQHLIDLWTVLRKIFKVVFITTAIILVLPGYADNKILIDPYKPAVLQLLNLIIGYSLDSLSRGGEVSVFIGSPLAPISFYLNLGTFVAVLVSLPVTVKEMMSFVRPGLTDKEWEILKHLSKVAGGLFILGSFISYFIIMPVTLRILALSGGVVGEGKLLQMYSLDSVLNLLLWGTLGGGVLYASPVILLALIDLEVMTPDQVANRKREIIFIIFVIAAFVTPDPTLVSMLILSMPMIVIIEFIIAMGYKIELDKLTG